MENNSWTTGGLKYDSDKPPIDLVDPDFIEGLAKVLGFGAKKYAKHNWRNGINYSRLIAAAYRHLGAINKGEDLDPESGLPHVHHLACCVMFLSAMMETRPDLDDRWKGNKNGNYTSGNRFPSTINSVWGFADAIASDDNFKIQLGKTPYYNTPDF